MDETALENRITAVEIKLSYLEDFVNNLQDVVTGHSAELDLLKQENKMFASRLRDISEQLEGDIPDRKPPHY